MGCGSSSRAKYFEGFEEISPSQANRAPGQYDKCCVIGRICACEQVITPPFRVDDCVVVMVKVFRGSEHSGVKRHLFSAFSAVDFMIRDDCDQEVRVDMTTPSSWSVEMIHSQMIWNIARDSAKGGLVCGGTGVGQFTQQQLCPNGQLFWHDFSTGYDSWHDLTDMSGQGMQRNRLRSASVRSLKVGDAVAVIGHVRGGDRKVFLEGGEGCVITNDPDVAKGLFDVPSFEMPARMPGRINMRKIPDAKKGWQDRQPLVPAKG
eukprot:TRINITY_DN38951_c0_g1_i1.p1 TRINITY_DN38951_c0_g1~~TRINITY_DN38951_c0_g1_i1.p1  ORF type:complete len:262 (+),score=6.58 TRINITY_DN38951_c0_g1_i1:70-855(+)